MLEKSNILLILLTISVIANIYLYFFESFTLISSNSSSPIATELYSLISTLNRGNLNASKDFTRYLEILRKYKLLNETMYSYSTFLYFITLNETGKLTPIVIEKELQ